ncbi:glyoxalase/bleomycin resistance/extradiol dioxygenase family protein [Paenibacillus sp. R14(2021)]|uniref:VOC family protein n=1 Tax=Paenibacillus sp. R14(2021) TaxID=2859228 RepID=UPI001C616100|nr:VOC family protein [Paenibacillus sp. R14(2021)]
MNNDKPVSGETRISPWLSVRCAAEAAEFYKSAFQAVQTYALDDDEGNLMIAQFSVAGADFWVQQDPETSPDASGLGSVRMILTVADPDTVFRQAISAGAAEIYPVGEGHGWRIGRIVDPSGHHWEIGRRLT